MAYQPFTKWVIELYALMFQIVYTKKAWYCDLLSVLNAN